MIKGLCRGDRVKLTARFANVLMNDDHGPKYKGIDWRARRGTVSRLNVNDVLVMWDGRTSGDVLPHKAVEKVVEMQAESAA